MWWTNELTIRNPDGWRDKTSVYTLLICWWEQWTHMQCTRVNMLNTKCQLMVICMSIYIHICFAAHTSFIHKITIEQTSKHITYTLTLLMHVHQTQNKQYQQFSSTIGQPHLWFTQHLSVHTWTPGHFINLCSDIHKYSSRNLRNLCKSLLYTECISNIIFQWG